MVESLGWSSSPAGTGTGNGAADVPMMLASGGADNTTRIWSCFEPNAAGKGTRAIYRFIAHLSKLQC